MRVGSQLCTHLLEPLQEAFGRIHVRSGYRSPEVNAFGNQNKLNCASNEKNYASHIWDYPDPDGHFGATACIVVPSLIDYLEHGGSWTALAWWIHDHLPYSSIYFFSKLGAFNIGWHENPVRRIDSYAAPQGCLTRPGMANHGGLHRDEYADLLAVLDMPFTPGSLTRSEGTQAVVHDLPPEGNGAHDVEAIQYRAVHTKTRWRKAGGHGSVDRAVYGRNGAAGLFAGKVRTDYERHGRPLYVLVWQSSQDRQAHQACWQLRLGNRRYRYFSGRS